MKGIKMEDNENNVAETVVGRSVKIQGDLNSEGNIRIEGQVTGKVKTTKNVFVGQGARIAADVNAGSATISGEVQGNMKITGNLILQSSAKINGDISCAILRVEDGAQFTGKCAMSGSTSGTMPEKADKAEKTERSKREPEPER